MNGSELLYSALNEDLASDINHKLISFYGASLIEDKDKIKHEYIDILELKEFIEREIEILRGTLIICEDREFAEGIRGCVDGLCCALFWISVLADGNKTLAEKFFDEIYHR